MIKFQELKVGDHVMADNEGDAKRGEITGFNKSEKQVCINTGAQDFWYEVDQLSAIPVTDEELAVLKFTKQPMDDGSIKYIKGAFRMLVPSNGDFSRYELWYRDEARHIHRSLAVHELQNHFYEMTKVHLNTVTF